MVASGFSAACPVAVVLSHSATELEEMRLMLHFYCTSSNKNLSVNDSSNQAIKCWVTVRDMSQFLKKKESMEEIWIERNVIWFRYEGTVHSELKDL